MTAPRTATETDRATSATGHSTAVHPQEGTR